MTGPTLYSVGHSIRPLAAFLELLAAHEIETISDVRLFPRSRRHPHFGREALAASLAARGIRYVHLPELGGMRAPDPQSRNQGLANPAFRGYADHMASPAFEQGVASLIELAGAARTAMMCAEADRKHCHRSLLADALLARGIAVEHLVDPATREPHRLHPAARVANGRVTYPAAQQCIETRM